MRGETIVQLKIDISFYVLLGAHDQRKFFGGGGKNAEMVRVLQGALQVPPVDPALKFAFCTRAFGRSADFEKAATN